MVKTRRSSKVEPPSPVVPDYISKRQRYGDARVEELHPRWPTKRDCYKLLSELFERCEQGWWYKILPDDDGCEDITSLTGLKWETLLPLFMEVGLLSSVVTSMVKRISVVRTQWNELAAALLPKTKMEVAPIRTKTSKERVYYICFGLPKHKSVLQQQKNQVRPPVSLHFHRRLEIFLARAAFTITMRKLAIRVVPAGTRVEDISEKGLQEIYNQVEAQIDFALALDLKRRPRLSRTNAGKW